MFRFFVITLLLSACASQPPRFPASTNSDDMYRVFDDAKALKLPVNNEGAGIFYCYRKEGSIPLFKKNELFLGGLSYLGYSMQLISYRDGTPKLVKMKPHAFTEEVFPYSENGREYQFQQKANAFDGRASVVSPDGETVPLMCYQFFQAVN